MGFGRSDHTADYSILIGETLSRLPHEKASGKKEKKMKTTKKVFGNVLFWGWVTGVWGMAGMFFIVELGS
jgi:hypothetical protein